jgi:hypothetical protein
MKISYNQNKSLIKKDETMTQEATHVEPNVLYISTDPNSLYTLIMYDPDAVTSANNYVHWTVTNIRGTDIKSGTHLLPYYGPHPPPGSGKHHYIFELFKQENATPITVTLSEEDRKISKSVLYEKLGLTGKTPDQTTQFIVEALPVGGKNLNMKRKTMTLKKKRNNKRKTKRTTRKNRNKNKNSKKQ